MVAPGFIVTNRHVIEHCGTIWVAQRQQRVRANVKLSSQRPDLALLEMEQPLSGVSAAPLRSTAALGEDILVAGYPLSGLLSSDLIVTSGIVNALTGWRDAPTLMQISAQVQQGNSGGPVLDRTGAVVGVVVSKLNVLVALRVTGDIPQNINFAIKPDALKAFLAEAKIGIAEASPTAPRLEGAELAARARASTVGVECHVGQRDPDRPLRDSIRSAPPRSSMPPVPEFHDTEARLRYLQWQATTSLKLSQIKTDPMERREYLQTVWFESRRAGLSPSLVLSMTDQLSGFRKFNTSAIGARGYMSVLPGITRRLSDGDAASLFHMQTNYRYGCVMLRHYIERRKGDVHAALLDYLAEASINRPRNDKQVIATAREILKGRAKWRVLPDD